MEMDMSTAVTKYMESLGDDYELLLCGQEANEDLGLAEIAPLGRPLTKAGDQNQKIYLCRLPVPIKNNNGLFVYKGQGLQAWPHVLANEAAAMEYAARWREAGHYEHARVPELYCCNVAYEEGEEVTRPLYLCMEYIPGTPFVNLYFQQGCTGWTFREKRSFVRQMALFRLSMLLLRNARIGGLDPTTGYIVTSNILSRMFDNPRQDYTIPPAPKFYETIRPQTNALALAIQGMEREISYWSKENMSIEHYRTEYERVTNAGEPVGAAAIKIIRAAHQADLLKLFAKLKKRRFRKGKHELPKPSFCLMHGDMDEGYNVMMNRDEKKFMGVIDWELAMIVPYSEAIKDLNKNRAGAPNPEEWERYHRRGKETPFDADRLHRWPKWEDYCAEINRAKEARDVDLKEKIAMVKSKTKSKPGAVVGSMQPPPKLSESNMDKDNFAAYGRLIPEDLYHGDRFSDEAQAIERRDDPEYAFICNGRVKVNGRAAFSATAWYQAPVLHLIDQYMQEFENANEISKWADPWIGLTCFSGISANYVFS